MVDVPRGGEGDAVTGAIQRNNPVGDTVLHQRDVAAQLGGHKLPPNRAERLAVLIRSLPQCQRVISVSWPNEQKLDKYSSILVA
jgi:hypothetical protein